MARLTKAQKQEQQEAIEQLRKWCPPGTKIFCVLRHVSRSGMRRKIDLYTMYVNDDGQCGRLFLTGLAAKAMDYRWDNQGGGVIVDGCGMDMGFHLVHNLSYTLHGHDTVGESAKAHEGRPFKPSKEEFRAGYSLTMEWL